ncbi:MAG: hypothetical protein HY782_13220 [Chloroflexi bacterium]|nr:hypothetical protein [Chloroflexota bacterium]
MKEEPIIGEPIHCKRCPDYANDGGIWKIRFDKGIYRVYTEINGWRSLGSYTVSGDRLELFNDPTCTEDVGRYTWKVEGRNLILTLVEDACAIRLRGKNLTSRPWASCQPPNIEAAITTHWEIPRGCDTP